MSESWPSDVVMPRRLEHATILAKVNNKSDAAFNVPLTPWRPLSWEFTFDTDFMPLAIYKGRVNVMRGIYSNGVSITENFGITEAPDDGLMYVRQSMNWTVLPEYPGLYEIDGGIF